MSQEKKRKIDEWYSPSCVASKEGKQWYSESRASELSELSSRKLYKWQAVAAANKKGKEKKKEDTDTDEEQTRKKSEQGQTRKSAFFDKYDRLLKEFDVKSLQSILCSLRSIIHPTRTEVRIEADEAIGYEIAQQLRQQEEDDSMTHKIKISYTLHEMSDNILINIDLNFCEFTEDEKKAVWKKAVELETHFQKQGGKIVFNSYDDDW